MRFAVLLICLSLCLFAQADPAAPQKGIVAGKVLNSATGEPVRKAHVSLFGLDRKSPAGGSAITDAAGSFEFSALAAGDYLLIAAHDGFVPPNDKGKLKEQRVTLASGEEKRDIAIRLTPFGVVTGRILDEDGDPIRRVDVQTMVYEYTSTGRQLASRGTVTSDDRGEYRLYDLAPGRYYVRAGSTEMMSGRDDLFATTYYPATQDASAASAIEVGAGQEVQGIDLTLHRTRLAHIRGRVVNPGSDLSVGLTAVNDHGSATSTRNVDDPKGKFELAGVSPGTYSLIAKANISGQHSTASQPIQVGFADLEGIELHLLPPLEIVGQIRVEGKTTARLSRTNVLLEGGGGNNRGGETKDDGSFVLEGLEPGIYQVSVHAPEDLYLKTVRWSDRDVMQSGLDLTQGVAGSGLVVILSANGGGISGVVEDDRSAPFSHAVVALVPDAHRNKALFKVVPAGRDGRFRILAIAPGSYKLYAFEDLDPNRLMYDPDFLRSIDSQGHSVEISEGGKETVELKVIKPAEDHAP